MKNIVIVNGLPRSGKDTLADYLVETYDYVKVSFATTMKQIIATTLGITLEQLEEYKNNPDEYKLVTQKDGTTLGITNFRDILRRFGSEGMKPVFGDDVWARITYEQIMKMEHENIVISDFRFLVEYLPSNKERTITSILVKDDRPLPLEGHASDVELYQNDFHFDLVINNPKTEVYFKNIDVIMSVV